jgi:hypothetical protein
MHNRMKNPAMVLPEAPKGPELFGFECAGIGSLLKATASGGVSEQVRELVGLRVSQINGCPPSRPGARRPSSPAPSAPPWPRPNKEPAGTTW